jgi:hypothetical protein
VALPVHAGGPLVVHLHPIGADVSHARFRIAREDERPGDVAASVLRPARKNRQLVERTVRLDDFLARAVRHRFWRRILQPTKHRQHLHRIEDA